MDDEPEDRVWIAFAIAWAAVLFCAFMAVMLSVRPANAQQPQIPCKPFVEMKAMLEGRYREHEVAFGLMGPQRVMVLFVSEKTWTLIAVSTSGESCIVASGAGWTPAGSGREA